MIAQPPLRSVLVDPSGHAPSVWTKWFISLANSLNSSTPTVGSVRLAAQGATIGSTVLTSPAASAGRFLMTYYLRVTQAATTSSSVSVTVRATDGGVIVPQTSPAVTGNTVTSVTSGAFVVQADAGTTVQYATTYTSTGATPMLYTLSVSALALPES